MVSQAGRLAGDAALLGVRLGETDAARLLTLLEELARWNRRTNLTAITDPQQMITHHLLDSLAISPDLTGTRVADVGTGAGFPGLPLAVANPGRQFTLIDSNAKKLRFVAHAAALLGIGNVTTLHARAESLHPQPPFDTVTARALAPLPKLLAQVATLVGPATRVLAMKGRWPEEELAALPASWSLASSRILTIPGLDAARCVLVLSRLKTPAARVDAAAGPSSP
ncbi:MAG: 16S rRNA (guanine(527)-N(7))-methyltransferase RsmG [Gammaproteobacteria bacterium]|nr:16S rRNA (guanine(527)-N(7))-methyltransferase RsmG [Gammaproteobacteria bacterium]